MPDRPAGSSRRIDLRVNHTPLGMLAVAGAIVSVAAAVVAVRATLSGRLSQRPPRPGGDDVNANANANVHVHANVTDGHVHRDVASDLRRYAFTVALTNRSRVERTIVAAGIRVNYRTRANFLGAVDLPLTPSDEATTLRTPLQLLPGETSTRIAQLETSNIIPRHCRVEGYAMLLVDESGNRWTADASLPQVLRDDHDGDGPRTWGWD